MNSWDKYIEISSPSSEEFYSNDMKGYHWARLQACK